MKVTKGAVQQALEFERIEAASGKVGSVRCLNRKLYVIPGVNGIFRRVSRSAHGLNTAREGARLATFDGSIVELIRDQAAETEIREAGFTHLGGGGTAQPQLTRVQPGVHPGDVLDQAVTPGAVMVDREAFLRPERGVVGEETSPTPQGSQARPTVPADAESPTPPEADGEGLTAAEILEEQRRGQPQ